MNILTDNNKLELFQILLDKVVEKAGYSISEKRPTIKELGVISEKINSDELDKNTEIAASTLRDYRYMYLKRKKYPLKVQWSFLERLCQYADYDINLFSENDISNVKYRLNLLIFPGLWASGKALKEKELPKVLHSRYESMAEEWEFEGLNIILDNSPKEPPSTFNKARQVARDHNADMILWGDYLKKDIRINFLLANEEKYKLDRNLKNDFYFRPLKRPSSLYTGDILKDPDFVLFYIFALDAYADSLLDKALRYLTKLDELSPNDPLVQFRIAVVYHEMQLLEKAAEYYLLTIENSSSERDETYYKAAINLSQVYTHQEKYDDGIQLLTTLKKDISGYNQEQVSARLLQLYFLQGEISEGGKHAVQLKGLDDSTIKKLDQNSTSASKESFVVLKGGDNAMNVSTGDILFDGALVTANDELKSIHGLKELDLISLFTKNVYKLKLKSAPVVLMKAIELHDAFKTLRSDWFDQYAEDYPWLILNPTKIPIPIYKSSADDIFILQFENENESINLELDTDPDKSEIYIAKDDITFDDELIGASDKHKNIKLLAYNPYTEEQELLYKLRGFVIITPAYLKDAVKRFQSYFPTASKDTLNLKTIEFVYQTYGVLPESYITTLNNARA